VHDGLPPKPLNMLIPEARIPPAPTADPNAPTMAADPNAVDPNAALMPIAPPQGGQTGQGAGQDQGQFQTLLERLFGN
jgi:hypothetical protein